ncbi:hypothetical protein K493DRAFT_410013 [Basidiobolus meristosporus CBS 931.73]|uniref:G-protein coupled receptors family 3 profile domain-containing protein n=1 Tax=Basidiobolus meristosporus CBS 931.73 TaxID=1314790 RepID=A0A1Y1XWV7_9FUNG|nr:hypothetical protein K493DRAFT_410013 [Basidiobolus meristosporus CBS 931.73]|eukprot:ORX90213.1 hypothetical protein K493DRAFT_410013 [Basidiobolus meristosporus CBS 931.73]
MDHEKHMELNDQVELLMVAFTFFPVARDVYDSMRMVVRDRALIYKLNLVQSFLLLATGCMYLGIRLFAKWPNCVIYFFSYCSMSFTSVTLILTLVFLRSICINRHARLIKGIFAVSQLTHLTAQIFMMINTRKIFAVAEGSCSWTTDDIYIILLLTNSTFIVVFFASMTIVSIYKYARANSSPLFKVFIRDGLISLVLISLVSILVLILQVLKVIQSGILLHSLWMLLSLITTQQCRTSFSLRNNSSEQVETECTLEAKPSLTTITIK